MPTVVNWPTGRAFVPTSVTIEIAVAESVFTGQYSGQRSRRSHLADRWLLTMTMAACRSRTEAYEREAFLHGVKSRGDWLRIGLPDRQAPRGTARGTMLVSGAHAAGVRTLAISGSTASGTLLAGDMLSQGGNHLLQVDYPGVTLNGSGAGTVPLVLPLPVAMANGAAVAWSAPTGTWALEDNQLSVSYSPGVIQGPMTLLFRQAVQ